MANYFEKGPNTVDCQNCHSWAERKSRTNLHCPNQDHGHRLCTDCFSEAEEVIVEEIVYIKCPVCEERTNKDEIYWGVEDTVTSPTTGPTSPKQEDNGKSHCAECATSGDAQLSLELPCKHRLCGQCFSHHFAEGTHLTCKECSERYVIKTEGNYTGDKFKLERYSSESFEKSPPEPLPARKQHLPGNGVNAASETQRAYPKSKTKTLAEEENLRISNGEKITDVDASGSEMAVGEQRKDECSGTSSVVPADDMDEYTDASSLMPSCAKPEPEATPPVPDKNYSVIQPTTQSKPPAPPTGAISKTNRSAKHETEAIPPVPDKNYSVIQPTTQSKPPAPPTGAISQTNSIAKSVACAKIQTCGESKCNKKASYMCTQCEKGVMLLCLSHIQQHEKHQNKSKHVVKDVNQLKSNAMVKLQEYQKQCEDKLQEVDGCENSVMTQRRQITEEMEKYLERLQSRFKEIKADLGNRHDMEIKKLEGVRRQYKALQEDITARMHEAERSKHISDLLLIDHRKKCKSADKIASGIESELKRTPMATVLFSFNAPKDAEKLSKDFQIQVQEKSWGELKARTLSEDDVTETLRLGQGVAKLKAIFERFAQKTQNRQHESATEVSTEESAMGKMPEGESVSSRLCAHANRDYMPQNDSEISLKTDEVITNIRKRESKLWIGTDPNGKTGLFPANYVTMKQ